MIGHILSLSGAKRWSVVVDCSLHHDLHFSSYNYFVLSLAHSICVQVIGQTANCLDQEFKRNKRHCIYSVWLLLHSALGALVL